MNPEDRWKCFAMVTEAEAQAVLRFTSGAELCRDYLSSANDKIYKQLWTIFPLQQRGTDNTILLADAQAAVSLHIY